jgi:hypothetical protein
VPVCVCVGVGVGCVLSHVSICMGLVDTIVCNAQEL